MAEVMVRMQDPALRERLRAFLEARGCGVVVRSDLGGPPGGSKVDPCRLTLVITDWSVAPDDAGVSLVRRLRGTENGPRILVLARDRSEDLAIEAIRLRVDGYFKLPVAFEELAAAIVRHLSAATAQRAAPLSEPLSQLMSQPQGHTSTQTVDEALVGETAQMRALRAYLDTVALTDCNVLITGETGAGKEMVARQLHRTSRRRNKPFVCINCAAIPESLIESELFGYDRGAFTGATSARAGKLQQANGGTVFFDEIGEMSRFAQVKILRAIEAKEIYPLGAQRSVQLNVRVIAATNRDLEAMVRDDSFRSDLYFRLKVVRLILPPLRERLSDIPLLVKHWLPVFNAMFGRHVTAVDAAVLRRLMTYSWPGNVRELRNVLEISFLNLPPHATTLASLPDALDGSLSCGGGNGLCSDEREQLLSALVATRWNISEAARRLRWSRMTIYRRLAKYEMPITRPVTPKPSM